MRRIHVTTIALGAVLALGATGALAAQQPMHRGIPQFQTAPAVPNSYIVSLKTRVPAEVADVAHALIARFGGTLGVTYTHALRGFSVHGLSSTAAAALARSPLVKYVAPNTITHASTTTQTDAPKQLDRVDQHSLPLDHTYTYGPDGSGVRVYGVDSGIWYTHDEFRNSNGTSRATFGYDAVGDGQTVNGRDCEQDGHGTHTAALAVGKTYGIAKKANAVAVRVLDCTGSSTAEVISKGLDWVAAQSYRPAVANLSFGTAIGTNTAEDEATQGVITAGITVVVAAGNGSIVTNGLGLLASGADACGSSPADVPAAITVSALDDSDNRAAFANYGSCVDLFASGYKVTSATQGNDSATKELSGTSQAAPIVAGVAALYLSLHPAASPAEVQTALINNATNGAMSESSLKGSPNRIVYTGFMSSTDPGPTPTPTPTATATVGPTAPPTSPATSPPSSGATKYARPYLQQASSGGAVTLQSSMNARYSGKNVTFYVRSGQTGQVRPLGQAVVTNGGDGFGYSIRHLQLTPGQALRVYCKVEAVTDMTTPYSNDVDFRVK